MVQRLPYPQPRAQSHKFVLCISLVWTFDSIVFPQTFLSFHKQGNSSHSTHIKSNQMTTNRRTQITNSAFLGRYPSKKGRGVRYQSTILRRRISNAGKLHIPKQRMKKLPATNGLLLTCSLTWIHTSVLTTIKTMCTGRHIRIITTS